MQHAPRVLRRAGLQRLAQRRPEVRRLPDHPATFPSHSRASSSLGQSTTPRGRLRAVGRLGAVPQVLAGVVPVDDPGLHAELPLQQRVDPVAGRRPSRSPPRPAGSPRRSASTRAIVPNAAEVASRLVARCVRTSGLRACRRLLPRARRRSGGVAGDRQHLVLPPAAAGPGVLVPALPAPPSIPITSSCGGVGRALRVAPLAVGLAPPSRPATMPRPAPRPAAAPACRPAPRPAPVQPPVRPRLPVGVQRLGRLVERPPGRLAADAFGGAGREVRLRRQRQSRS